VFEECIRRFGVEGGEQAARAVCSAIARHHGPRASKMREFELPAEGVKEIAHAAGFDLHCTTKASGMDLYALTHQEVLLVFGNMDHCAAWPLYAFLVRRLRLADQAAMEQLRPTG